MQAGHDATRLPASLRQNKIIPHARNTPSVFGDPDFKPLLVMKGYKMPLPPAEEAAQKAKIDAEAEEFFSRDIFKQIEERKKRLLQKAVQDWDVPAS